MFADLIPIETLCSAFAGRLLDNGFKIVDPKADPVLVEKDGKQLRLVDCFLATISADICKAYAGIVKVREEMDKKKAEEKK